MRRCGCHILTGLGIGASQWLPGMDLRRNRSLVSVGGSNAIRSGMDPPGDGWGRRFLLRCCGRLLRTLLRITNKVLDELNVLFNDFLGDSMSLETSNK